MSLYGAQTRCSWPGKFPSVHDEDVPPYLVLPRGTGARGSFISHAGIPDIYTLPPYGRPPVFCWAIFYGARGPINSLPCVPSIGHRIYSCRAAVVLGAR